MGFIFWLGSDRGSASHTHSLLETLLARWWPQLLAQLPAAALETTNVVIRKLGHFSGYGLLCLLDARALRGPRGILSRRLLLLAWAAAVCWATVDEIHQSFSASRGASATDVLLDSMGAAFGLLVYHFWLHRKSR
jgi:VanZ family protein